MTRRSKVLTTTELDPLQGQGRVASADQIPDKMYFRIGEVAELIGVKSHVLRYWEKEFATLKPQKSRAGQRMYRRRDVETLLHIRGLLYDLGYTIAGARKMLKAGLSTLPTSVVTTDSHVDGAQLNSAQPTKLSTAAQSAVATTAAPDLAGPRQNHPAALVNASTTAASGEVTALHGVQQLPLGLDVQSSADRRAEIKHGLLELIALCDRSDSEQVDPFSQLRRERQHEPEERVVVKATSRSL